MFINLVFLFKLYFRVFIGFEDVFIFLKLIVEFLCCGYSDEDVSKVVGRNFFMVMERMEKVMVFFF